MMDGMWVALVARMPDVAKVLMEMALKGGVILALTAVAVHLFARRTSAAFRHLVWVVGMGVMLLIPVLSGVLPRWQALPALIERPALAFDASTRSQPAVALLEDAPRALPSGGVAFGTEGTAAASAPGAFLPGALAPAVDLAEGVEVSGLALGPPTWAWLGALGLWAAGAGILGASVLLGLLRVATLERRARPLSGTRWEELLRESSHAMGVTTPIRLLASAEIPVPMTWGFRTPVVALPAAAAKWEDARVRQALLHELAHVTRRDQPVLLAARLTAALHWFNPLAWYALRRVYVESEQAADDRVLNAGARPSEYAAVLVDVARALPARRSLPSAVFAMARSSHLGGRVEAILDPDRRRSGASRFDVLAIVIVACGFALPLSALAMRADPIEGRLAAGPVELAVAPVLPVEHVHAPLSPHVVEPLPAPPDAPRPAERPYPDQADPCFDRDHRIKSDMVNVDDEGMKARWSTAQCEWELDLRGEVAFSGQEDDVGSLSADGHFEVEQTGLGVIRRVRLEADGRGRLERGYWVDGDERPGSEAAEWLAQLVPEIYRVTGLDAEARVDRILARGGVDAVLQEVGQIRSGYTVRIYLTHLLSSDGLSDREVAGILDVGAERIDSDYEMAEVLRAVRSGVEAPVVRAAYLRAVRTIDSDYETRRTLEPFLQSDLTPSETETIIKVASDIDSDFEVVELLLQLVERTDLDAASLTAFLDVIQTVESDYEARRALTAALAMAGLSDAHVDRLLDRVDTMDSDYERAEVLIAVIDRVGALDGSLRRRVVESAERLSSDYESDRVLAEVARAR